MTKIIDLNNPKREDKPKNPIEFCYYINEDDNVIETNRKPNEFDVVEIITEGYVNGFDVFLAYQESCGRNSGFLFFGRANDKVIS